MNRWKSLLTAGLLSFGAFAFCAVEKESRMETGTDLDGRTFQYVKNDPFAVRIYRLKNGMTLYLSRNPQEPSVHVMTVVRAGSVDEPSSSTGLAHYFEHMMFKGTARIGALDFPAEKKLLDRISDLFEERRQTQDPAERARIYEEIDRLSCEASRYAVPGEFSKLASAIGADEINAFTGYEMTAYIGKVPSNELENYMLLDSERFKGPVLRLFHTELETVYEEFNRSQDQDSRNSFLKLMSGLFPDSALGRSVIGLPEHLKAPSMKDIYAFYDRFYVPGNMALCMTGDLEYEKAVALAEKYYGALPEAPLPEETAGTEIKPQKQEVFTVSGPESEHIRLGFRIPSTRENNILCGLLARVFSDGGYGMLDQQLMRGGKVLEASAGAFNTRKEIVFIFYGAPLQGQSLEDVEAKIRGVLNQVAEGKTEDWRIPAVAANLRVQLAMLRTGNPADFNEELATIFANRDSYADLVDLADSTEKITPEQLAAFVKKYFSAGVTVRKIQGERSSVLKVEKPEITPVTVRSDADSAFAVEFLNRPEPDPVPVEVIDPQTILSESRTDNGLKVIKINRDYTEGLFAASLLSPKGKLHDPDVELAMGYMEYLGTDKLTAEQLRQEFYKLGVKLTQDVSKFGAKFEMVGPEKSFPAALALLQDFLLHAKPDPVMYAPYAARILKMRENERKNPQSVFMNAVTYAWYGPVNPKTFTASPERILSAKPEELIGIVQNLFNSSNTELLYSGPDTMTELVKTASLWNKCRTEDPVPHRKIFPVRQADKPRVWVVDYDKVQLMVGLIADSGKFDLEHLPAAEVLNAYFFSGLDSVVFQEIREARALAYAAGGNYSLPMEKDYPELVYVMAGTQPDKLKDVLNVSKELLKEMPYNEMKFNAARDSVRKRMGTKRLFDLEIYDFLQELKRMNVKNDWRADAAEKVGSMDRAKVQEFFRTHVAERPFDIVIAGRLAPSALKELETFGEVILLKPDDIFPAYAPEKEGKNETQK